MGIAKRLRRLGGISVTLGALGPLGAMGCAMAPEDGGAAAGAGSGGSAGEPVGRISSRDVTRYGNIDCQGEYVNIVQAMPLSAGSTVSPVIAPYIGSVGALLSSMCPSGNCPYDPIYQFTLRYWDIEGAAGYFYLLQNFFPTNVDNANPEGSYYWIGIPIIDSQQDVANPVPYYPNYPNLSAVRYPMYSDVNVVTFFQNWYPVSLYNWAQSDSAWPEVGGQPQGTWVGWNGEQIWPFLLRSSDYSSLANAMTTQWSLDSRVAAQDQTCVLIVDKNNRPLDFSAHMAQWDPRPGCTSCSQP
jgi:hypothetical protein